ncbi:DUF2090 domain-containing protein [Candidatus Daviesbacteria bacterium]|nr:DUF2090 domain-containing protein [Candidatus Daviesbacteria bacterium]
MNLDKFKINNKFLMLALDHRGSFKKLMNPDNPESVSDQAAIDLKSEIIKSVEEQMSGVLVDIDFGLPGFDKQKPFLLPAEKTGYSDSNGERITQLEKSAADLLNLGAAGVKLLLYFNPSLESAKAQLETAKKVLADAHLNNLPLFLEIVTYEINHHIEDRESLVLGSLQLFLENEIFPDVFKLEYPGNFEACLKITEILKDLPWILLTRGVTFDEFVPQLKNATKAGAVGFLAGRALWQEVCTMQGEEKEKFLKETLPERFKTISEISIQ